MKGFIPENGKNVCSKRYGDCKGLSSLLYTMLNYAEIDAYLTWVGTRDKPYSYYDVPAPIVDNHMILTAIVDDEYYYLDATGNTIPLGEASSFIQGKEVMIGKSQKNMRYEKSLLKPLIIQRIKTRCLLKLMNRGLFLERENLFFPDFIIPP